jgi:hypothetical protein
MGQTAAFLLRVARPHYSIRAMIAQRLSSANVGHYGGNPRQPGIVNCTEP